jgi:bacterioferritin-associated ferredoxin
MIVCLCHRISDRDIERAAQDGVRSFDELQDETCIARNCACCEDCAREVFDDARRACTGTCGAQLGATVLAAAA